MDGGGKGVAHLRVWSDLVWAWLCTCVGRIHICVGRCDGAKGPPSPGPAAGAPDLSQKMAALAAPWVLPTPPRPRVSLCFLYRGQGVGQAPWGFRWNSRHSPLQGPGRHLNHPPRQGPRAQLVCVQAGAGLPVLGGTGAGGVCRTENRAWVASSWGLESGQQPGLPLRGLPRASGHRPEDQRYVGHRERVGTAELDTAVGPERGPAGASEPSPTTASINGCAQGAEPGGSLSLPISVPCAPSLLKPSFSSVSAPVRGTADCLLLLSVPLQWLD